MGNRGSSPAVHISEEEPLPKVLTAGIELHTSVRGDGKTYPQPGQRVLVHYTGTLGKDGTQFDSSRDRGDPFAFTIGQREVILCWDEAIRNMSVGERALLKCPAETAYGKRGAPPAVPPHADLTFDVEVLKVK